jgi:ankyrin repeat protein
MRKRFDTVMDKLIEAVIANDQQTVSRLLAEGANPNGFIDRDKLTPLFFAVQNHALAAAFLLLAAGANPHYYCKAAQTTPIDLAKQYENPEMLTLLTHSRQAAN